MRCWRAYRAAFPRAALLLAYADWLSHLAAAPQRQIEIAQGALIEAKRLFDAAQNMHSPDHGGRGH